MLESLPRSLATAAFFGCFHEVYSLCKLSKKKLLTEKYNTYAEAKTLPSGSLLQIEVRQGVLVGVAFQKMGGL